MNRGPTPVAEPPSQNLSHFRGNRQPAVPPPSAAPPVLPRQPAPSRPVRRLSRLRQPAVPPPSAAPPVLPRRPALSCPVRRLSRLRQPAVPPRSPAIPLSPAAGGAPLTAAQRYQHSPVSSAENPGGRGSLTIRVDPCASPFHPSLPGKSPRLRRCGTRRGWPHSHWERVRCSRRGGPRCHPR